MLRIAVFALVVVSGCVRNFHGESSRTHVVGGAPLAPGNPGAASAVGIVYAGSDGSQRVACSGVLVSSGQVLTAAHCIRYDRSYFPFEPAFVVFAAAEGVPPRMKVSGVKIHPAHTGHHRYAGGVQFQDDDLALLELEGALPATAHPVKLLPADAPVRSGLAGAKLTLVGFGYTNPRDENSIGAPFSIESTLREQLGRQFVVTGRSQGGVQDTCEGDSGGPAYLFWQDEWYLLGVLSTGTSGCYGTWSTYTDVAAHDWSALVPFVP